MIKYQPGSSSKYRNKNFIFNKKNTLEFVFCSTESIDLDPDIEIFQMSPKHTLAHNHVLFVVSTNNFILENKFPVLWLNSCGFN